MNKEEYSDWEVKAVINQKALAKYIAKMANIFAEKNLKCIVSAKDEADALKKAEKHFETYPGISTMFVKVMYPRKST